MGETAPLSDAADAVLRVERFDDRVVATLNRPEKRNAIDQATIDALHVLCAELEAIPRILILTGADGVFAGLAQNPRPGESVFVIVPCPIDVTLDVDDATLGGLTAPTLTSVTTPEALRDFVGDGAIFRVTFAAGDTPAAPVDVVFRVTVRGTPAIPLQVTISVQPP